MTVNQLLLQLSSLISEGHGNRTVVAVAPYDADATTMIEAFSLDGLIVDGAKVNAASGHVELTYPDF